MKLSAVILSLVVAASAFAAAPITVTVTTSGNAVPGATISAKAAETIEPTIIHDGRIIARGKIVVAKGDRQKDQD